MARVAVAALSLSLVADGRAFSEGVTSSSYTRPHQLVPVQGPRRLDLFCVGHGTPVVVFESGLGGDAIDWRKVQGPIGQVTEACSYDRAGYGFSDPADRPSDATDTVDDLHRLLRAASVPKPVILVGHSIAGLYLTLYAATYPSDVAGVVLLDPSFPDQDKVIRSVVGPATAALFREQQNHFTDLLKRCVALAREGKLSEPAQAKSDCLDNPPNTDPVVHDAVTSESETLAYESANRSEWASAVPGPDGLSSDDHEVERANPSFGSIPVLVLTAGDHPLPPNFSKADAAALTKAGQEGHERLAALSTRGEEIVVPHSGHYIQIDQPDVVIDFVKKLVIELRHPIHATDDGLLQSLKRPAEPRQ